MNNDDDTQTIIDLGNMLRVMLAQPDADSVLDGMRHVAGTIVDCARSIRRREFPNEGGAA
jgi:hypothetical protein